MNKFFTSIKNLLFKAEVKFQDAPKEWDVELKGVVPALKSGVTYAGTYAGTSAEHVSALMEKGREDATVEEKKLISGLKDTIKAIRVRTSVPSVSQAPRTKLLTLVVDKLVADYKDARDHVVSIWGEDIVVTLEKGGHTDAVVALHKGSQSFVERIEQVPNPVIRVVTEAHNAPVIEVPPMAAPMVAAGEITMGLPPKGTEGNPFPTSTTPEIAKSTLAGVAYAKAAVQALTQSNGRPDGFEYSEISDATEDGVMDKLTAAVAAGWTVTGPIHQVWLNANNPGLPADGSWGFAYSLRKPRPIPPASA